jgi:hypothetical protein
LAQELEGPSDGDRADALYFTDLPGRRRAPEEGLGVEQDEHLGPGRAARATRAIAAIRIRAREQVDEGVHTMGGKGVDPVSPGRLDAGPGGRF